MFRLDGSTPTRLASVGAPPLLDLTSHDGEAFILGSQHATTFSVRGVPADGPIRVAYAVSTPAVTPFVIYAERSIPPNRQVPSSAAPALAGLDYATYLGPRTNLANLATTNVPVTDLPLGGDVARESIPFGSTTLTLVATGRGQLGGSLGYHLSWIFLIFGLLLTAAIALSVEELVRRRRVLRSSTRRPSPPSTPSSTTASVSSGGSPRRSNDPSCPCATR